MQALRLGPADYERALAAAGLNGVAVFHRQTTGSTNDDARALVASGQLRSDHAASVVIAEEQTHGRGRGSNSWFSPDGSIALTVIVPGVDASRLGVLPLGAGAAVAAALRGLGAAAFVKWPNDVLIDGRKVCGILCESSVLKDTARVFVGVGVNVAAASFEAAIGSGATTLAAHGLAPDRPSLVADITGRVLSLASSRALGARIVDQWKSISVPWWGETVSITEGESERRVTLLDVNPEGQLVVRDEGGVIRSLFSGDVRRVRPAAE